MKWTGVLVPVLALLWPVLAEARAYDLRIRRQVSLPLGKVHTQLRWDSRQNPHGIQVVRVKDGAWEAGGAGYAKSRRQTYKRTGPARGRAIRRVSPALAGTTWAAFAAGELSPPADVLGKGRRLRR